MTKALGPNRSKGISRSLGWGWLIPIVRDAICPIGSGRGVGIALDPGSQEVLQVLRKHRLNRDADLKHCFVDEWAHLVADHVLNHVRRGSCSNVLDGGRNCAWKVDVEVPFAEPVDVTLDPRNQSIVYEIVKVLLFREG